MKLRRFYAISLAAFAFSCGVIFWVSTILPSFVSVLDAGKFERSLMNHEAGRKQRSSGFFGSDRSGLKENSYFQELKKILKSNTVFPSALEDEDPKVLAITLEESKLSTRKPSRHVTKSLAELGYVSGKVNPDFLFFNRVPKCGSEMLVLLLQWLQGRNGFKHVRLGGGNVRRLKRLQQEEVVEEVLRQEKEGLPLSFDRHVYWLNFSSFDHSTPVWINLIRDPVEKAASRFYYARELNKGMNYDSKHQTFEDCVLSQVDHNCIFETGRMYDLTIPYFCGHEKWCMALNDQWALEEAKSNVDRFYPVVGVLEEINATLSVLERKLPRFFSGVQEMYFTELLEPHHNKNRKRPREISEDIRLRLKSVLKMEYEFYNFIKSRLLRQKLNSW
ncbi:uronyl 2-sulfotransferase-like [Ischnura elegans]|uniref:uronyl 2-sulfotransferase-like n=1 Tax=Ischnura elegans TaxID=197161 RepID=UPI001ED8875E|nr:uronyl 2-sulfotransferase-like [Ischnura elegans]